MRVTRNRQEVEAAGQPGGVYGGVLVPTMGALHRGHAALIGRGVTEARRREAKCGVSIFVNPAQFNEREDFERYPRELDKDLLVCERAGVDWVFAPDVETVYPPGEEPPTSPLPAVATEPGLEDAARPGHFEGVCLVLTRLFGLLRPSAAVFGEKDWQQLQVARALCEQLASAEQPPVVQASGLPPAHPIEVIGQKTVRDPDGMALSSRNVFLSPRERERGLALSRALCGACGERDADAAEGVMRRVLAGAGLVPDYAVVRDASSLVRGPGERAASGEYRALVAARVGPVRLLDNAPWPGDREAG